MSRSRLPPLHGKTRTGADVESYFVQHNIRILFEDLSLQLAMNRPADPCLYICKKMAEICGIELPPTSQCFSKEEDMSYIRMHLEWRKDGKHSSIRASRRSPHASDKEWGEWCQILYQDVMSSLQPNEVPVPSSFHSRVNKDESPAEPAAP